MKLVWYLLKRFIPVFLAALFFFVLILQLVDLLMNLWNYIANQSPPAKIAELMLLYLPKAVSFALPLAVLFAGAYSLAALYAQNELIVIFTSGIPLVRFVSPLLIVSFFLSIGLFFFEDAIVVPTYAQKRVLQKELLQEKTNASNERVVVLADKGKIVYRADYYDDINKRLLGITVVQRSPDFVLERIIKAKSASWGGEKWNVFQPVIYEYENGTLTANENTAALNDFALIEPPETFRRTEISIEEITLKEARIYLSYLKRAGLPVAEAESQYYKRFSFPFVVFIVVFLSAGLSGRTRKNVLPISLVLCVSAAVLFYALQMVTMLLAKFGYISPFIGAWFPVILFTVLSGILLKYTAT